MSRARQRDDADRPVALTALTAGRAECAECAAWLRQPGPYRAHRWSDYLDDDGEVVPHRLPVLVTDACEAGLFADLEVDFFLDQHPTDTDTDTDTDAGTDAGIDDGPGLPADAPPAVAPTGEPTPRPTSANTPVPTLAISTSTSTSSAEDRAEDRAEYGGLVTVAVPLDHIRPLSLAGVWSALADWGVSEYGEPGAAQLVSFLAAVITDINHALDQAAQAIAHLARSEHGAPAGADSPPDTNAGDGRDRGER